MMTNTGDFTITPEQVENATREKARHEAIISASRRRIMALDQFLSAAAILGDVNHSAEIASPLPDSPPASPSDDEEEPDKSSNLMALIEYLANHSGNPMTKKDVKANLEAAGIAPSRLQNYFYVAIERLKKRGRISVLQDGRLWKAGHVEPQ
jgi:hypothetical protein